MTTLVTGVMLDIEVITGEVVITALTRVPSHLSIFCGKMKASSKCQHLVRGCTNSDKNVGSE